MERKLNTLFYSAMETKNRTKVTNIFVQNGFKIARTDFDDVVFENKDTQVLVEFDRQSNAQSISVVG
ncbi:hypothetical protein [Vibrio maerlii]|uniref:hypothetical protein n=1 Tax=Vibrio maerlii TaxID=2231648 RepID=UPI000E3DC5FA|nr:hypothetical protein [Vibrio maerlii]